MVVLSLKDRGWIETPDLPKYLIVSTEGGEEDAFDIAYFSDAQLSSLSRRWEKELLKFAYKRRGNKEKFE